MTKFGYFVVITSFIIIGGIVYLGVHMMSLESVPDSPATTDTSAPPLPQAQIANPASVNCTETLSGTLEIIDTPEGQQGVCHLPNGTVCEEWALMRGECGSATTTTPTAE